MSQSDLLIGGESSFFRLGAFLCKNCTVIHASNMFHTSAYEKNFLNSGCEHITSISCIKWLSQDEYRSRINPHKAAKAGNVLWKAIALDEQGNEIFTSYEGNLGCYLRNIDSFLSSYHLNHVTD